MKLTPGLQAEDSERWPLGGQPDPELVPVPPLHRLRAAAPKAEPEFSRLGVPTSAKKMDREQFRSRFHRPPDRRVQQVPEADPGVGVGRDPGFEPRPRLSLPRRASKSSFQPLVLQSNYLIISSH